jgi:hypothetical protein
MENHNIEFPYSPYSSNEAFHEEIMKQMFNDPIGEVTGNCVPQEILEECAAKGVNLKEWSEIACKSLQRNMFSDQQMTVSERKVFIRLFYAALEEKKSY